MNQYLYYEDFGAKGDGVTDDFESIIACHEEANKTGTPVKARTGATYYVGGSEKSAIIKTDVDFTGAKIIIDDRNVEKNASYVFQVLPDEEIYDVCIEALKKTDKHIDIPHEGNILVSVYNDNKKIFIRKGLNKNNGASVNECFTVDSEGNIGQPINWDYPEITRAWARSIDDKPITIKGGTFVTIANHQESFYKYLQRGFGVSRSHVTICDFEHFVEGELDQGAPYHGFIRSNYCVDLTIRDAIMTPRFTYYTASKIPGKDVPMGSYDLSFWNSIDVRCINIKQTIDITDDRYWGIYTSNFCKNLVLEDCVLSRFDSHQGVTNATIRRCKLGHQMVKLIGHGEFLIEDSEITTRAPGGGCCFIALRGDYGSIWDGNITIRNCIWNSDASYNVIIGSNNQGEHDYGYTCYMGRNVTIDGFTFNNGKDTPKESTQFYIFAQCNGTKSECAFPYVIPESVTCKNIVAENGVDYGISVAPENFTKLSLTKG
jgi:hypothetical protein